MVQRSLDGLLWELRENNLVPSASFRYKRKAKKRFLNCSVDEADVKQLLKLMKPPPRYTHFDFLSIKTTLKYVQMEIGSLFNNLRNIVKLLLQNF